MKRLASAIFLALFVTSAANAAWVLDGKKSALSFVSTKSINFAEVHRFTDLSGGIDSQGRVDIMIGLSSVDTGIELRDDRMRDMLFETEQHGLANVSAQVDMSELEGLTPGDSVELTVEGNLSLHGESRPLVMEVLATRSGVSSSDRGPKFQI